MSWARWSSRQGQLGQGCASKRQGRTPGWSLPLDGGSVLIGICLGIGSRQPPIRTHALDAGVPIGHQGVQVCPPPTQRIQAHQHVIGNGDIHCAQVKQVKAAADRCRCWPQKPRPLNRGRLGLGAVALLCKKQQTAVGLCARGLGLAGSLIPLPLLRQEIVHHLPSFFCWGLSTQFPTTKPVMAWTSASWVTHGHHEHHGRNPYIARNSACKLGLAKSLKRRMAPVR